MHDRIRMFPDGYQSTVGERGLQISGGEQQCVILARTLLQRAPILLMDEATAALDNETERDISQALLRTRGDRRMTLVMVAHRLSTVVDADLIVVVAGGRNVEQGTHSSLLAKQDGQYRAMWMSQVEK
jgi:ABC-type transport system involved in Fe-S cluster assembly fused permease/ATPase subunit